MPEDLKQLALLLARHAGGEPPIELNGKLYFPELLDQRERVLISAVHDALMQGSIDPLRDVLGPLDIACMGPGCERASHPDTLDLCLLCNDASKTLEEDKQ